MKKHKKNHPEISFIVPAYNNINLLKKTIQSIQNQTNLAYEILVIDDCSNKPLKNFFRTNKTNLRIFRNINNRGPSYSRNLGAKYSKADYLCFLDSDDILSNNFGSKMLSEIKKYESPIICLSSSIKQNDSSYTPVIINDLRNIYLQYLYKYNNKQISVEHFFLTSPSRMIFPKKIAMEFPFNEKMRQCEDWEMILRLMRKYSIYICPKKMVGFRFSKTSQTSIQRKKNGVECYTNMINLLPMNRKYTLPVISFRAYIRILEHLYV